MKKFSLVQRGKFRDENVRNQTNIEGFFGGRDSRLINPDYMGISEFEYGAVPKAYRRFMRNCDEYTLLNLKEEIGLENTNGVPFWVYVHSDDKDTLLESIADYIADLRDRDKVRKWRLKSWTDIDKHIHRLTFLDRPEKPSCNFWWCVDETSPSYVGDWFMFVGGMDRVNAFLYTLKYDHDNWWNNLPPEERG